MSYRNNYIPWRGGSLSNNINKQNTKEKNATPVQTSRYAPRNSNSSTNTSASTSTYSAYRQTPPIIKKYSKLNRNTDINKLNKIDNQNASNKDNRFNASNIPRTKPTSKISQGPQESKNSLPRSTNHTPKVSPEKCQRTFVRSSASPEIITQVTRATSPTLPINSLLRNDDTIFSEIYKSKSKIPTNHNSSQTDDCDDSKIYSPASRVAVLTCKFSSTPGNKFNTRMYTKPTELPIRRTIKSFSSPSPERLKSEMKTKPTEPHTSETSFVNSNSTSTHVSSSVLQKKPQNFHNISQTVEPSSTSMSTLNQSLTNLTIDTVTINQNLSDSEEDSSYDENYPIKIDKEPCNLISNVTNQTSELVEKPPRYPLSPKLKQKNNTYNSSTDRYHNVHSLNTSDSSNEEIQENFSHHKSPQNDIPVFTSTFNDTNNNYEITNNNQYTNDNRVKTLYPIRKMDSGELPWWLNTSKESSIDSKCDTPSLSSSQECCNTSPTKSQNCGYIIRKMDSTEIPWWCSSKDSTSSDCNVQECSINNKLSSDNQSESEGIAWWFSSKDSNDEQNMCSNNTVDLNIDIPKFCDSVDLHQNSYSECDPNINAQSDVYKNTFTNYKIRKMDSTEMIWSQENSSPSIKHEIPLNVQSKWHNCSNSNASSDECKNQFTNFKIQKMDSTEMTWNCDKTKQENLKNKENLLHRPCSNTSSDDNSKNQFNNFKIRKMDSTEMIWNCENFSMSPKQGNLFPKDTVTCNNYSSTNVSADESKNLQTNIRIRKMDSTEMLWSSDNSSTSLKRDNLIDKENASYNQEHKTLFSVEQNCSTYRIRRFDSGEKAWWENSQDESTSITNSPCSTTVNTPSWWNNENDDDSEQIESYSSSRGYRIKEIKPVEKLSQPNKNECQKIIFDSNETCWESAKENITEIKQENENKENFIAYEGKKKEDGFKKCVDDLDNLMIYVGNYSDIDEVLGIAVPPSAAPVTPGDDSSTDDDIGDGCKKITASQVKIHDGSARTSTIRRRNYQLDDAALQLYKDGDYSSYLDLDSSITEQQEEFEGFQPNRKDSIVVRTQLSVRVHLIIEKLMKSEGRELRRALFSLKQIFQEDKDLVHEFVQNDGLDCLIKVGSDVDQNYQNYILRALGQVMLYVDGMNGVMEHNPTIQWLYSLVNSKFRLVVKTVLKLLLVFVEYVESNCLLLIQAIHTVDTAQGSLPWSNIMKLLHEYDTTDTELLIYATTLINKTLNDIPDQDTYYDQVDLLEEQNIESVVRKYMSKQGTDLDLLRQFHIYEAVLQYEDGEDRATPLKQLDETIRKTLRNRKSLTNGTPNNVERRKSRRHSTGTTALSHTISLGRHHSETTSPEEHRIKQSIDGADVTPGFRRRRERAERQRSLLREQYENNMRTLLDTSSSEDGLQNGVTLSNGVSHAYVNNTVNKLESLEDATTVRSYYNGDVSPTLKREATVKDITQKLATLQTPDEVSAKSQNIGRVEEMKGIISKAMEGLAKSQSRCDIIRSPTSDVPPSQIPRTEPKKSETELHWEELLTTSRRPLQLCDLDFSDLKSDDEHNVLAPACSTNGIPPPPPPCALPPPVPSVPKVISNKGKKTVKLFWKEVREDPIVMTKLNSKQLIWDEMYPVTVDTQRLEHLFESRAKDLISKKQHELNKNKEIIVLNPKRSNAINIGMTKLPPPRSIKTAILKMDSTVMNREGIEKLLTMLPTEEERSKIQEAQVANPDLPLGSAEHFLLTLASISELTARLKLWSFKLNYENIEKEIADPLMDLKQGMEVLRTNKTFRLILSTLLSIGIFLNGTEVKGFQVEYLSKVPEVKDTVHKHSLLHHLCRIVMEQFPDSTDLYSEIGAVTRASRVDFEELSNSIVRIEQECKASFDHLKAIAKHDGNTTVKLKISDFLADCAERIIALGKIHRRVLNRFHKFCLWLGIPLHRIQTTKPNELCKIISEFALEYRTTRERVIQQLEKKASHRERNKTRGKMITDMGKFRTKEDKQDAELRQLLGKEHSPENGNENSFQCGSLPWRRLRKDNAKNLRDQNLNGHLTDADDELLETLVKTATKAPASRNAPRERKRTRHADRKSLRRTLKNGLTEEERNYLAAYIKSY